MITDVPSLEDFERAGVGHLNTAWEMLIDLVDSLDAAERSDPVDQETKRAYWQAAQQRLSTALALVHQAADFLLMSRIARISPYLLLSGNPREWPRECDKRDTAFADFHTVDAHELMRLHNTVVESRICDTFRSFYEDIRRRRNSIMHTVDARMRVEASELLRAILEVSHELIGPFKWIGVRRDQLEDAPSSVAHSTDHVGDVLLTEVKRIVDMLPPADTGRYLDFDAKARKYYCLECAETADHIDVPKLACLRPNEPASTTLYCFVCDTTRSVVRAKCRKASCPGNVIDEEANKCLTCRGIYSIGEGDSSGGNGS